MKIFFTLILFSTFICNALFSQTDSALVYGEIGKDYNRSAKLLRLPGGNLIWVGEWNNDGIIMKISPDGKEIKRLILSDSAGTLISIKDAVIDNDNTIVLAGECEKCVKEDSFPRVVVYRLDTTLNTIKNKSLILGTTKNNTLIYNPSLAVNKNRLMLIASQAAEGLNFEDIYLAALNTKLDTIWTKSINSCGNCGFEYPVKMTATATGFATFAYHAFTDSATIFHFDDSGKTLWKQRTFTWNGVAGGAITYANNKIYIGVGVRGLPQDPFYFVATLLTIDEKSGTILGVTSLNDPFIDRAIVSLEFAKRGALLMGYRRAIQNFSGSLLTSQILRLDLSGPSAKFLDATLIPNPSDITNMGIVHAVPLNDDGTKIGAIGIRGFFNRTFYYSHTVLPTVPFKEILFDSKFSIYPNPVMENQSFSIQLPSTWDKSKKSTVLIYNQAGQLIREYAIPVNQEIYSSSGLIKGWYTIVIKNPKALMSNKLMVF